MGSVLVIFSVVTFLLFVVVPHFASVRRSFINYFVMGFMIGYKKGYHDSEAKKPNQYRMTNSLLLSSFVKGFGNVSSVTDILTAQQEYTYERLVETKKLFTEEKTVDEIQDIAFGIDNVIIDELFSEAIGESLVKKLNHLIMSDLVGNYLSTPDSFTQETKDSLQADVVDVILKTLKDKGTDCVKLTNKKERLLFFKHMSYLSILIGDFESAKEFTEYVNSVER